MLAMTMGTLMGNSRGIRAAFPGEFEGIRGNSREFVARSYYEGPRSQDTTPRADHNFPSGKLTKIGK